MSIIPESHRDLFDLPAVWHVATIGPSGEPHSSPVWADFDGTHVRFPMPRAVRSGATPASTTGFLSRPPKHVSHLGADCSAGAFESQLDP